MCDADELTYEWRTGALNCLGILSFLANTMQMSCSHVHFSRSNPYAHIALLTFVDCFRSIWETIFISVTIFFCQNRHTRRCENGRGETAKWFIATTNNNDAVIVYLVRISVVHEKGFLPSNAVANTVPDAKTIVATGGRIDRGYNDIVCDGSSRC